MRRVANSLVKPGDPLRQRLVAEGLGELYDSLVGMEFQPLSERYDIQSLWAVGGQSVLFRAQDRECPDLPLLARLGLLPYHRPAYLSQAQIEKSRRRVEWEAEMLRQFGGPILPGFHGVVYAINPLLAEEWGDSRMGEPYLIMELVTGVCLADLIRPMHMPGQASQTDRDTIAVQLARTAVALFQQLGQAGYLYVDFNPTNVQTIPEKGWLMRVLDAGSILPKQPDPMHAIPYTASYTPPEYFSAYESGNWLWPDERFVAYTLGVSLWQLLTNRQPFPGRMPDLTDRKIQRSSAAIRELVVGLISGAYPSFHDIQLTVHQIEIAAPPKNAQGLAGH